MILTAYQPAYLPWLGLFDRVRQADLFVLCDTDRYTPKDFCNRNRVMTKNGPVWLTVPVLGGRDQRICDVLIDNTKPWARKHWRTIESAYSKALFFNEYAQDLEYVITRGHMRLEHLNDATIYRLLDLFDLSPRLKFASEHGFHGSGSDFILDMCQQLGATKYLCGSQGRNYLNLPAFEQAGIEVEIQDYTGEPLSAIHHLFTKGPVF